MAYSQHNKVGLGLRDLRRGGNMTATEALLQSAKFESVLDLARLPYFEVREGRLALADPALGPAIDVHTHLALTYVLPNRVDLRRAPRPTEHYLPARGRPIDLEVYVNKNFTDDDLRRMRRDLVLGSFRGSCGMRETHTIPNLEGEMRDLGIVRSVLLPVDMPVLSTNARRWLSAIVGHEALVGFGSVHPFRPGLARELDRQVAAGARGVKVHPAVQLISPENGRALRLYRLCGERALPVLFHCGPVDIEPEIGRRRSQVRLYERGIAECPETTFVLGHSGALQMEEALGFARRYPNVWLEVSSQSLGNVRRILAEAPPERLVFGTDWPFYHQGIQLAKVLIATEGKPDARRAVLYGNAARLLKLEAIRPRAAAPGRPPA
jgi:predicted TIM-barrel fold metal-dependent hydrolase